MMKNIRLVIGSILLTGFSFCTISCDKFFDVNTDDVLLEENNYVNISDVYAGILGVSSAFQQAADHYIVLSELLGDAVTPTYFAPMEFWEIFRYRINSTNKTASPEPFYRIILNSNDFLRHIVKFNKANPNAVPEKIYKGLIASALSYRSWAYLTIGKIYGEAIYHDLALVDDTDLSKERLLSLDEIVKELIHVMKNGVDGVNAFHPLAWDEIMGSEAKDWFYISVQPDVLMAELHLWNNDPWAAAQAAVDAICSGVTTDGKADLDKFKLSDKYAQKEWVKMFSGSFGSIANEALTAVPFDYSKNQTHKLQYYFSDIQPNVYYLAPQPRLTYGVGFRKGTITETSAAVVSKYHLDRESYKHDGHIYIYRAADAWLMLAEALVGTGDFAQADSILNVGMSKSWDGKKFLAPFDQPLYRADMQKNIGIRGRAGEDPLRLSTFVDESHFANPAELENRKRFVLDSLIASEVLMETAFEGKRWFTLLRMARNLGKPEFLAKPISVKFGSGERELYRIWLMEPKNWFIKYEHVNQAVKD